MTLKKILKDALKNGKLDLRLYKKYSVSNREEGNKFEQSIKHGVSRGFIVKRNNFLRITQSGIRYLDSKNTNADGVSYSDVKKQTRVVKHSLGISEANAKLDAKNIAESYKIPIAFSKKCKKLAKTYKNIDMDNVALEVGRVDLRGIKTVTIDGVDSKDFDDAISIEATENGFKLGVHIADVSHFIAAASLLDTEARLRGNSVYLIDTVYPMFPEEISNGVCSLNEGVTRFTLSVFINIDCLGNAIDVSFCNSAICSSRRLTYDYAQDVLDNNVADEPWIHTLLNNANTVKDILLKKRIANGGLEFDLNETYITLDSKGEPTQFSTYVRKETHKIIEELMLLANCAVAERLSHMPCAIYRVHGTPDFEKLQAFLTIAFNRGYHVIKNASGEVDFRAFTESIRGKDDETLLLRLMLRSMKQAVYDTKNIGHFGLGFDYYTHFTSPIRRYTDLLTHRLLKMVISGDENMPKSVQKMYGKAANWCSKTERISVEIERDLHKVKAARFMKDKVGLVYSGIVSGIAKFGMFISLEGMGIEGLIRYASLDTYFDYDEETQSAYSHKQDKRYTLGDKIEIKVVHVDIENQFIDFVPK